MAGVAIGTGFGWGSLSMGTESWKTDKKFNGFMTGGMCLLLDGCDWSVKLVFHLVVIDIGMQPTLISASGSFTWNFTEAIYPITAAGRGMDYTCML